MVREQDMEELLDAVEELLSADAVKDALSLIIERHPADQADVIEHLDEDRQKQIITAMNAEQLGDLVEYLDEEVRSRLLEDLPASVLVQTLDRIDEDIAADIVQDLPPESAREVVAQLEDREEIEELLTYREDSAGGIMSTEVVALQRDMSVDEAINYLRNEQPDPHHPFYLYVVDPAGRLTGTVSLRSLVTASPDTPIAALMGDEVLSVSTDDDQEVAIERMRHYSLLALPVVDPNNRLRGVITSDISLDVQSEEATEDIYRMAGIGVKEWAFSPVWESAGRRVPWLAFNMIWAFAGAVIISLFEGTLDRVAALAIFMPMIAGQAGNAGIQTATIVVRSMALGEMDTRDAVRVLKKEWILGLLKGVIFGVALGIVAWIWRDQFFFGFIAGGAMFLNMMVASTTGVIVPMTLRRVGIDPATIAGVFDTMVTDFMGFLIYLGLATIFISQLT